MASITFRADEKTEAALRTLTAGGRDRSEAIRKAILVAAVQHQRECLRAQALALVADDEDRAEAARVQELMADLRAW